MLYPKNHDLRVKGEYKKGAGTYSHDQLTSEAIDWIRANKEDPFFLYLPYCIPHAELTVPQDSMAPYLKLGWEEKPKIVGTGNTGGGGYGSGADAGMGGQLKAQLIGGGVTIVYTLVASIAVFWVIDKLVGLRVSDEDEEQGLDLAEHAETGYSL